MVVNYADFAGSKVRAADIVDGVMVLLVLVGMDLGILDAYKVV